jgi:limonene-1,2-epoxide hydrolase
MSATENKATVQRFWDTLYQRDFDTLATFFGPTSTYTDIATPADDLAVGPEQIIARLRLGIALLEEYRHKPILMISEGEVVVTEHVEEWKWKTGETVSFGFTSVHELEGGVITRWVDYWDLQTLLNAAPVWWIEEIAAGYQSDETAS